MGASSSCCCFKVGLQEHFKITSYLLDRIWCIECCSPYLLSSAAWSSAPLLCLWLHQVKTGWFLFDRYDNVKPHFVVWHRDAVFFNDHLSKPLPLYSMRTWQKWYICCDSSRKLPPLHRTVEERREKSVTNSADSFWYISLCKHMTAWEIPLTFLIKWKKLFK